MLNYWLQQERHNDNIRTADRERLIKAYLAEPVPPTGRRAHALATLGGWLILWGCRLQNYATSS